MSTTNTPWNPNTHGFTNCPISTPQTTQVASYNSNNIMKEEQQGGMVPSTSSASPPMAEGPSAQGKDKAMVPLNHHMQRPPSSASNTSSVGSFGPSNVHSHGLIGGNNHHHQQHQMPPQQQYRQHPHGPRHGEPMMGAMRGQGHPHMPPNNNQNNNYHPQGLIRPAGRYPVQHSMRGGDQYGMNNMHHMQQQHGRNFHHQQFHSFPPQNGMEQRAPQGHPQQQHHHHQQHHLNQKPHIPPGVAVAIAQSQPLRRLSRTGSENTAPGAKNEAQEDLKQQQRQQPTPQQQQQQHPQPGQGQSQPLPHARPDHAMNGQGHHPSVMHQRYHGHHQQRPQHDHNMHFGGQPSMHHGVHSNNMQQEMHHYNYHHQGPPMGHNTYGHPDNGIPYPHRGHRDMYAHGQPQHHFQHHQQPPHSVNGYGQPLHHASSHPQRAPGHGFQIPKYNATRPASDAAAAATKAPPMSRSPSPPPSPPPAPSAQALLRQKLREQGAKKTAEEANETKDKDSMSLSGESLRKDTNENKPMALGDRGNVATTTNTDMKKSATETTKTTKQEEITADAASILLQLSSVMNRSNGDSENQNPKSPPIPTSVQHSSSMDDVSDAGTMLTMQTGEAPDLTSEPSTDSIDSEPVNKPKPVQESDFPCPVPDRYPTRLALPYDNAKLNTLHCFLRSELLEIFVVSKSFRKSPCHSPSSSVGRVGLRCVHCAMLRGSRREDREDAPMAVFYPKSIAEIYRLVTSWQRCHLRKCKNVPPAARARWQQLRETDRSRGKTHYWVTSAKQIGLMDCQSRAGGIRFVPDFDPRNLPAETKLTPSTKEAEEKKRAIAAKAQKIVSAMAMAVVPEHSEVKDATMRI